MKTSVLIFREKLTLTVLYQTNKTTWKFYKTSNPFVMQFPSLISLFLEYFPNYFTELFSIRIHRMRRILRRRAKVQLWKIRQLWVRMSAVLLPAGAILLTSLQLSEWVEPCYCSSSAFPIFWSLARKPERRGGCHFHRVRPPSRPSHFVLQMLVRRRPLSWNKL